MTFLIAFLYITSFNAHKALRGRQTVSSPILQLETLTLREAEWLAQDHTAGQAGVSFQSSDCGGVPTALGPECRDAGPLPSIWAHTWASLTAWNVLPRDTHPAPSDLCPEGITFSGKISLSQWQALLRPFLIPFPLLNLSLRTVWNIMFCSLLDRSPHLKVSRTRQHAVGFVGCCMPTISTSLWAPEKYSREVKRTHESLARQSGPAVRWSQRPAADPPRQGLSPVCRGPPWPAFLPYVTYLLPGGTWALHPCSGILSTVQGTAWVALPVKNVLVTEQAMLLRQKDP